MSDKQKIAFLCHPYHRGGVTRWMVDAAFGFSGRRWDVYFVTVEPTVMFISGAYRETMLHLLQKGNAPLQVISTKVGREFELGTPRYRAYVYRQLLLQLPLGTPIILSDDSTIWDAATYMHAAFPIVGVLHADDNPYYVLAEKHFRQVAVFASVSERVSRNAIQRVPQIPRESIFTIPCGINLSSVNAYCHDGDKLQLVYVGRITEYQKRVSDLAKICSQLRQKNVAFHIDIVGDGGDKAVLENSFKEAGLEDYVTFFGWQSQSKVNELLSGADILLLTSDFEGTPIAMMEALAAGCGVVGTRVSGIEDYELHPLAADCFAVFDVGDISTAVDGIGKIATVPPHTRQAASRKLAETEFSMDVCLDRYIRAIGSIKQNALSTPRVVMPLGAIIYSRALAIARSLKAKIVR